MTEKTTISFPGLGVKPFDLNPVAFKIFGAEIRWYALILCMGIIAAFIYFMRRGRRTEGFTEDDVLNVTLLAVPLAIVGARVLYVATNLDSYKSFWDMINIRNGGIAVYGAITFGLLTFLVYAKAKRLSALKLLDAVAPAVLLGQIIGRWGNFVNGEAFGLSANVEKLPWRMEVTSSYTDRMLKVTHPTFLYESLWNLTGFLIINVIYKRKKFDGQIFLLYVSWYGLGRGFIELLRADSLTVSGQKLMVYVGFVSLAAAAIFYFLLRSRRPDNEVAEFLGGKGALEVLPEEENDCAPIELPINPSEVPLAERIPDALFDEYTPVEAPKTAEEPEGEAEE